MSSRRRRTPLTLAILTSAAALSTLCPAATQHWVGDQDYPELFPFSAGTFFNPGMWRADLHVPAPTDDALFGFDPDFPFNSPNGNDQFSPFTIYFGDFNQRDPVEGQNIQPYPAGTATVTNLYVTTGSRTFNFGSGASDTFTAAPPPSAGSLVTSNYLAVGYNSLGHGPATLTCTGGSSLQVHDLKLGFSSGDTGTLNLTGGTTLNLDTFGSVGYQGTGTLNVSDGAKLVQATQTFYIGDNAAGSSGSLNVSGPTTVISLANLVIGNAGSGAISLSTGTFSVASRLTLGNLAGSSGSYTLSGGTLAVGVPTSPTVEIGAAGIGSFQVTGGSATFSQGVQLGNAGGTGVISQSAGSLTFKSFLAIGLVNRGTFTQTGGTNSLSGGRLQLGLLPGATGTYSLSGGTMTTPVVDVGGNSSTPRGAGILTVSGSGALSVTNRFKIYDTAGTSVSLAGGSLSVGSLDTGGNPARFAWTAGTLSLTNSPLSLSPTGPLGPSLTLSPSMTLLLAQPLTIAAGTLDLTSSNQTFAAAVTVSSGTLAASTGSLTAPSFNFTGAGPASASAELAGPGATLTKSGTAPATLTGPNSYTGLTTVAAGALTLGRHAWTPVFTTGADITNGTLLFDYTGTASPLATVESLIHSGTIHSSAADPTHTLGTLDDPASSTVTLLLTLPGDANLDGRITPDDYALLDRGFAIHGTHWSQGDFNFSGTVTPADYLLIDTSLGQAQGFTPGFLAQRESQFGPAYLQSLLTSVPEPSSLSSILSPLSSFLLLKRRRRQIGPR